MILDAIVTRCLVMDATQAIVGRRTVRRFRQDPVPEETLKAVVNAGRVAASGGNRQPWRFILAMSPAVVQEIFGDVAWLARAGTPRAGERPTAYIMVLGDVRVKRNYQSDCAAACQNMLIQATALGLGTCWIGSVNRWEVRRILDIREDLEIFAVIAVGYPAETPSVGEGEGIGVYRDEEGTLHVSKRPIQDVLTIV